MCSVNEEFAYIEVVPKVGKLQKQGFDAEGAKAGAVEVTETPALRHEIPRELCVPISVYGVLKLSCLQLEGLHGGALRGD